MQTETAVKSNGGVRYVDREGQAIKMGAVRSSVDGLVALFITSQNAAEDFSSTIKSVAEVSGILPSVLRKLVRARAKDQVDKAKHELEQLSLVFEEC
jgi:hypothetical protein